MELIKSNKLNCDYLNIFFKSILGFFLLISSVVFSQTLNVIDNKGTIREVESSNWTSSGNDIYNKNTANVGIGTSSPHASAKLDVNTTTGGLLPPRLTTLQRDEIVSPAVGLVIYNTTNNGLEVNTGTAAVPAWANLNARARDYFFGIITGGQSLNTSNTNLNITENVARGVSLSGNTITLRANRIYSITAAVGVSSKYIDRGTMAIVSATTGATLGNVATLATKGYSYQVGFSTSEAIVEVGDTDLTINVRVLINVYAFIDDYSNMSYIKITEL